MEIIFWIIGICIVLSLFGGGSSSYTSSRRSNSNNSTRTSPTTNYSVELKPDQAVSHSPIDVVNTAPISPSESGSNTTIPPRRPLRELREAISTLQNSPSRTKTVDLTEFDESFGFNNDKREIKNEVKRRDIKYLTHFTRFDNVKTILENGLLGRQSLSDKRISYYYNDIHRIDNIQNGICCSISFPNYKMFWGIKQNQREFGIDPDKDWVILRLKPELLWQKKAYFCRQNAASNQERFNLDKMDANAFKSMFNDLDYIERNQLNIPDSFTTNPQAEVVFIENIEPEWIIDICVKNGNGMNCYTPNDLNHAKYENETLFKPRSDYQNWTKH